MSDKSPGRFCGCFVWNASVVTCCSVDKKLRVMDFQLRKLSKCDNYSDAEVEAKHQDRYPNIWSHSGEA